MVNRLKNRADRDGRKGGFVYRERDPKKMKERAEQKGGNFDSIFQNGVDTWRPDVGDNTVRILPPTFEDAEHYGMDVWVHPWIGADGGSSYLCLKKMKNARCPICDAANEAKRAGEEEDAKELQVKRQVLAYILDRDGDEPEKPLVWAMSWTMDRDIAALCNNRKTGKIIQLDHPDKGFDVFFKRQGQKLNTRYIGIQIDRDPSPICKDERDQEDVLKIIEDKPLDAILKFYDEEYLEKVLDGKVERKADDDEDDKPRRRGRDDDDDDKDDRRSRSRDDDDDDKDDRRRGRDKDDDGDDKPKRGRDRDDDKDDDDDRGSRGRGRDRDKDDDDDRGRRRRDDDDDPADDDDKDPEEASRGRGRRGRDDDDKDKDDDDDRGRRSRGRSRDDDDDDKGKDDDDDRGSRRRGRDDDDDKDDDRRERVRRR